MHWRRALPNKHEFDAGELGALTPSYASCEMFEGKATAPVRRCLCARSRRVPTAVGETPVRLSYRRHRRATAKLVPPPIKGLKRREWRALQRGLAFERAERSANAAEFLKDLEGSPQLRVVAAVALTLALATTGYVVYDRIQASIAAAPASRLLDLPASDASQSSRTLLADGDRSVRIRRHGLGAGPVCTRLSVAPAQSSCGGAHRVTLRATCRDRD